jgi:thiamine-monophosphate kinase
LPLPEKSLIARIRRQSKIWPGVAASIGDDCALLKISPGHEALITTDFTLEDVHFRREWHPPESVGHRFLARGLSDIAAMGGKPVAAFLSLALPAKLSQSWVDRFFMGFRKLADRYKVTLAGGDIAQSPQKILADIMVVGSVPRGKAILRSGAHPGDFIYVTGRLGGSAHTLRELIAGAKCKPSTHSRHFFPEPRLVIGQFLRAHNLSTSMIDLSDGLSTDLAHICDESKAGTKIFSSAIPRAFSEKSGKSKKTGEANQVSLALALHGGEDYELLFTTSPRTRVPKQIAGVPITRIGEITRGKGILLVDENNKTSKLKPQGWEHFS